MGSTSNDTQGAKGRRAGWPWLVLALAAAAGALFFALDLDQYFHLDVMRARRAALVSWREAHPLLAAASYFFAFAVVAVLMLPVAAALSLLGGAMFGLAWGTALVSFGASVGAALGFLLARHALRDLVQARLRGPLRTVEEGLARDGVYYLATMRVIPVFPYSMVNLLMGLTRMDLGRFYLVTQLVSHFRLARGGAAFTRCFRPDC